MATNIARAVSTVGSLAGRAVHVRIRPRPRNLSDSRQVLRVLQSFGEVVVYRHLKYEPLHPAPNIALAVYAADASAQRLMSASPFTFTITQRRQSRNNCVLSPVSPSKKDVNPDVHVGIEEMTSPSSLDEFGSTMPDMDCADDGSAVQESSIDMTLIATPSVLDHDAYVERQGYYGAFIPNLDSLPASDLKLRVPMAGYADCSMSKKPVPWRVRQKRQQQQTNAAMAEGRGAMHKSRRA